MPADSGLWDQIAGKWKQFSGHAQKEWGKLTEDEITQMKGDKNLLAGKIQEKYGVTKEEAHNQIDKWSSKLDQLTK